jgi:hypothetical protein
MKSSLIITGLLAVILISASPCIAQERPKVGGYEQLNPGEKGEQEIGAGWGHRSMTYGMMNLMSGMTSQAAAILRTGKATPEMVQELCNILDHVAAMLNYAPAYMMGTMTVDSNMIQVMHSMLKDLEKMRKDVQRK